MLQLPTDVLRLIAAGIPHHERTLRLTFKRMSLIFRGDKLPRINEDITQLCQSGELQVLKLYPKSAICRTSKESDLCEIGADYNHLELLKWLRVCGIEWNEYTTRSAARRKHFELLEWAIQNGCPFAYFCYYYLSIHNNLRLIRELLSRDVSVSGQLNFKQSYGQAILSGAAIGGHLHIFQEFHSFITEWNGNWVDNAAESGHLELMKWLHQQGCSFDSATFSWAAGYGDISILKWLREIGCPWSIGATRRAACKGHLEALQWLVTNGCPINRDAVEEAAHTGHIKVLVWLRDQGHSFDATTTLAATSGGHLECLQWLREQGCHWNDSLCERASAFMRLEILIWARTNGCPWNRSDCLRRASNLKVRNWILTQPE